MTALQGRRKASSFYFANLGGGIHGGPNLATLGEICQWFQADNQGRGGQDEPIWGCTLQGRVCNAVLDGKMAANVVGLWSTGSIRWRESTKSPAEAQMWLDETSASGMTPYVHSIGGETGLGEDLRFEKIGYEYFDWTAKHDPHFVNKHSIANLGVVIGQRTQLFYKPPHNVLMPQYMNGMYYALLEGRFLFDFVHEDRLQPERLKKYSALILPNTALLSEEQCRQLRDYVHQGGSLLATFETSMYTDQHERRADFGLADVFGIHAAGAVIGRRGNSNPYYARIEKQHPILDGFTDTSILPGAEYRVPLAPVDESSAHRGARLSSLSAGALISAATAYERTGGGVEADGEGTARLFPRRYRAHHVAFRTYRPQPPAAKLDSLGSRFGRAGVDRRPGLDRGLRLGDRSRLCRACTELHQPQRAPRLGARVLPDRRAEGAYAAAARPAGYARRTAARRK
jgi:hypothetical protein